MKKLLLSASLIFGLFSLQGNAQNYTFSKRTDIYSPLVGGVNLTNNFKWDRNDFIVSLGFDFNFYGKWYNEVRVDTDGRIFFGPASSFNDVIYGYAESVDLVDRGLSSPSVPPQSPISYQVTGFWPDRIFKIEYKNVGFWPGSTSDNMNFQIWLYENGSTIEMHYGTNAILNAQTVYAGYGGPTVGIRSYQSQSTIQQKSVLLTGNNLNANAIVNGSSIAVYMNGTPLQHTTYTFTYDGFVLGTSKDEAEKNLTIFPNPTENLITVTSAGSPITSINVVDLVGKTVLNRQVFSGETSSTFDISELATGTYLMQVSDATGNKISKKIVKL